jgi:hypothetical protein
MMMLKRTQWSLLAFVLVVVLALAIPAPVFAQSCAMCYTAAAKSGPQMIQALKSGILILLFPPLFICGGVTFLAYRKRDLFNEIGS